MIPIVDSELLVASSWAARLAMLSTVNSLYYSWFAVNESLFGSMQVSSEPVLVPAHQVANHPILSEGRPFQLH